MANPKPVPSARRVKEPSTCLNFSKIVSKSAFALPPPAVGVAGICDSAGMVKRGAYVGDVDKIRSVSVFARRRAVLDPDRGGAVSRPWSGYFVASFNSFCVSPLLQKMAALLVCRGPSYINY